MGCMCIIKEKVFDFWEYSEENSKKASNHNSILSK